MLDWKASRLVLALETQNLSSMSICMIESFPSSQASKPCFPSSGNTPVRISK